MGVEVGPKRLELLHELLATARQMALLVNPTNSGAGTQSKEHQTAARMLGLISHDAKRAERAVREIAGDFPDDSSTMTLGDDPLDWHFVLGDEVQDKIVVRYIFEVPKDKDMGKEKESDAIAGRVFDMAEKLAELAGYFIWERTNYEPR
jgi:hypothetical protein